MDGPIHVIARGRGVERFAEVVDAFSRRYEGVVYVFGHTGLVQVWVALGCDETGVGAG